MFHVKHWLSIRKQILLTYTELPEDHVENVLDIDPAQQPAERIAPRSEVLPPPVPRPARPPRCSAAAKPPSPAAASAAASGDQVRPRCRQNSPGRNRPGPRSAPARHRRGCAEIWKARPLADLGQWPTGRIEIDLVAHQPDRRGPLVLDLHRRTRRRATARDPPPLPAPAPGARPPARRDRRSRECRRCRSPSPDSRRDRAAPR